LEAVHGIHFEEIRRNFMIFEMKNSREVRGKGGFDEFGLGFVRCNDTYFGAEFRKGNFRRRRDVGNDGSEQTENELGFWYVGFWFGSDRVFTGICKVVEG
jgi:hypothetical protein